MKMKTIFYEISLFLLLNILSVYVFIYISPMIDHLFGDFILEKEKEKPEYETVINISIHISILALFYILYYNCIEKLMVSFHIQKYIKKSILDGILSQQSALLIAFCLLELQVNMKEKLRYLSLNHSIRL